MYAVDLINVVVRGIVSDIFRRTAYQREISGG